MPDTFLPSHYKSVKGPNSFWDKMSMLSSTLPPVGFKRDTDPSACKTDYLNYRQKKSTTKARSHNSPKMDAGICSVRWRCGTPETWLYSKTTMTSLPVLWKWLESRQVRIPHRLWRFLIDSSKRWRRRNGNTFDSLFPSPARIPSSSSSFFSHINHFSRLGLGIQFLVQNMDDGVVLLIREMEKARRWQEIRMRQHRLRVELDSRTLSPAPLEQSLLTSGFSIFDLKGENSIRLYYL